MHREKLWTKDFIMVSIINFLLVLVFFLLMVTIAGFAVEKFNASTSVAGLVSSIFIIGALIGRIVTGRVIQNAGSKKILLIGLVSVIITTALYFASFNLTLLIINRLLHGMAVGIASTATGTIIAQIIPFRRRGEGIGYFSLSAILATSVGPLIGILLNQVAGFKLIFSFNLILGILTLLISFFVSAPRTESESNRKTEKASTKFHLTNYLELKAVPISFVVLIAGFSYSGILSFITFYAEEIHLEKAASYYFLAYSIIVLISRPISGRLMDLKGANIIIYPCLFIFSVGMYVLSNAHHGITLLLASTLIGIGFGNFQSVAQAISIKVTESQRLGLATSTYYIFYDLGLGIGPYLLGFLIPIMGFRNLYLMMVFVILSTIVLYYFLHGRKDKELIQNKRKSRSFNEMTT